MNISSFRGFVGLIEWDDWGENAVIIAATAHQIRRDALTLILTTNPDTQHTELLTYTCDEDDDFLTDNPLPDLDDVEALHAWHHALRHTLTQPMLTIYGPEPDPQHNIDAWHTRPQNLAPTRVGPTH